jgi:hypothetical protein
VVTGLPGDPRCTCPDFTYHDREHDPLWQCKHIQAVLKDAGVTAPQRVNGTPVSTGDRGVTPPPAPPEKKGGNGRNGNGAVMLLKRSVSPDGRIDSLSVEFSCPVGKCSVEDLKAKAETILALQGEIAGLFLKANGKEPSPPKGNGNGAPDAVTGQLLGVASMNGKYGRRLFLNVLVNGQVLKLFGSEKQLSEAVKEAGFPSVADHLVDGFTLNLPCRVVTKPSPDGKYTNIERVLPAQAAAPKAA